MTNGFGAGFATLGILAVIAGVAALLGLLTAGLAVTARRPGRLPGAVRYAAVGLLVAAVGLGGFGVVALLDEAAFGAVLFGLLVFLPLAVPVARGWRAGRGWIDVLAVAALAWSGPFLLGFGVFLVLTVGVIETFQLAGGEVRALGLTWLAAGGGGAVAVIGTALLDERLARWLRNAIY